MRLQTNWVDPYLEILESEDSAVFQELLQVMVNFPSLLGGLTQNCRTPAKILAQIIESYKDLTLIPPKLLGNPNCPRELVDYFINNPVSESQHFAELANNENLNRSDFDILKLHAESAANLAGNLNLPADVFIYIWENYLVDTTDAAFSLNLPVLKALACNPKTPLKILRNLSKYNLLDSPGLVKSLLMSNPSLPSEMRVQFALLNFDPVENVLIKTDSDWYPTNLVFSIEDFPEHLLLALVKVGHPGGFLRTDIVPSDSKALDSNAIFDLWVRDQSIYKTLWPEVKGAQGTDCSFLCWYKSYEGFTTYFDIAEIEFEHEERQEDGDFNYHAIPNSPEWLPHEIDYSDALLDYEYLDFETVASDGVLEWALAWNLSNYDPEYISLVDDDSAIQFMWDQHVDISDYFNRGILFAAKVEENLRRPYSWKSLSSAKKAYLIEFIENVFLKGEDSYYQYAEHFLICICLNPHTDDELIQRYFIDKSLGSDLIEQALEVRKSW